MARDDTRQDGPLHGDSSRLEGSGRAAAVSLAATALAALVVAVTVVAGAATSTGGRLVAATHPVASTGPRRVTDPATPVATPSTAAAQRDAGTSWPHYGNDAGGSRFSPLDEIDRDNVQRLQVAWTYRTGESVRELATRRAASEATPILVDGTLYFRTPLGRVIALDPATGRERWRFDAGVRRGRAVSRGVAAWLDREAAETASCRRRVFATTGDARLIALDGATGEPCVEFGRDGERNLRRGIRVRPGGSYRVTSPPAVVGDLVVVGSAIGGNEVAVETRGIVRAFDARSGRPAWRWDPLPGAVGKGPGPRIRSGAANVWAPMSVDEERDLLFVSTSSASPDHFGGRRPGDNLFANSVVALRGSTGERVWHFQVIHHDLWDHDVSTQPTLLQLQQPDGDPVPAVAVGSKAGHLFVLHRETGEPLLPVREARVPRGGVPGETPSPTQPVPAAPPTLVAGRVTPANVFGMDPADRQWCRERIASLRRDGPFTPPSLTGSLMFPAPTGGFNWGSLSFHPDLEILVGNTSRIAGAVQLIPRDEFDPDDVDDWRAENPSVTIGLQKGTRYVMRRELLVRDGVPCNPPPWGQLAAVDARRGRVLWQVPLGVTPAVADHPDAERWGSRNIGGALVTGGGLVFIAATLDDTLRAFDIGDGSLLWETSLPAGGQATPMTYETDGRQYVVLVAGGHGFMGTTLGDHVVAFALP